MKVFRNILSCLLFAVSAIAFSAEEESLPRVLILGDIIYRQPAAEVSKALKGRAEVVFASVSPDEVATTQTTLKKLDELLGEKKWDLIHFNLGLGDLVYRAPGMKSFRALPIHAGGIRTTSPEQYSKNLNELVERLKATKAKLIWASTTPIRASSTNLFEKGSEIEYNTLAAKVMTTHQVPINDMHSYVTGLIDMEKPAGHGADPFTFDKKPVHEPIVSLIVKTLNLPKAPLEKKD